MSEYVLPKEVRPFKDYINNTGGNDVEELVDRFMNEPNLLATNMPVFMLAVSVYSQVLLIQRLIKEGRLR